MKTKLQTYKDIIKSGYTIISIPNYDLLDMINIVEQANIHYKTHKNSIIDYPCSGGKCECEFCKVIENSKIFEESK